MVVISGWEVPDLPEEDHEDGCGYESYADEVETVHAEAWTVQEAGHRCHAVLDSGATETVTSLTALTEIMNYRKELFGDEDVKVYPADGKSFRFGNGRTMLASSFVPMLIGMRTRQKLEVVVDFRSRLAIFPTLSPDMITLHQCPRTGHLMIDLSADWARTSAYMALPAGSGVQEGSVEVEPVQVATDGHVGVEGQLDEDAHDPAARIKRLFASRPSENPESNGHGPGQQADQQGRSERPAGNFVNMQYFGQQEGQGQGEEGEQVERGSDLRHGPEGGPGHTGSPLGRRSMCRKASASTDGTRLPQRQERLGQVDHVLSVQASSGVHPGLRSPRLLSVGGAPRAGREGSAGGEAERGRFEPSHLEHHDGGLGRSREEFDEEVGDDPQAEGSQFEEQEHYGGNKEDAEAEHRNDGGGARGAREPGEVGADREGGVGRVGQGPEVEEEEVEATQASTRSLISESLENMLSEMRECMQELGSCFCGRAHFGAPADPGSNGQMDLLEVCCAPDSLLASMVNVRVTEASMNINTAAGLEEAKRCVRNWRSRDGSGSRFHVGLRVLCKD